MNKNKDGFMDLFIGGRATPFAYGKIPPSYLLQNDGTGHFKNVTEDIAKELAAIDHDQASEKTWLLAELLIPILQLQFVIEYH